jgi:hypothetical protein
MIRKDQIVFAYFHLAANEALTRAMVKSKSIVIADHPEGRWIPAALDLHERGGGTDGDPGGR